MRERKYQAKEIACLLAKQGYAVTDDTIRNWYRRGVRINKKSRTVLVRLSGVRVGGRLFFSTSAVRNFFNAIGAGRVI